MKTSKNIIGLINAAVALSILISSAFAQQLLVPLKVDKVNRDALNPGKATIPQMGVQQLKTVVNSPANTKKVVVPIVSPPEIKSEKVITSPVLYKARPQWMTVKIPKEDVRPPLPSTIIKPVETKPVIQPESNPNPNPVNKGKLADK